MNNEMKIASIYAQFSGDLTPTAEEMYHYLQLAENFGSAAATASIISNGPIGDTLFSDSMSYEDKVKTVFTELFGREPLQGGLDYWVDQLENNSGYVNETSMAQAILRGAEANADQSDWNYVQSYASSYEERLENYASSLNNPDNGNNSGNYSLANGLFTNKSDSDIYITDLGLDYEGDITYNGYSYEIDIEGTLETGIRYEIGNSVQTIPGSGLPDVRLSPSESVQLYNFLPDNIDMSAYADMQGYAGEINVEIDVITTVGIFTDNSTIDL